tara:strand:+ start:390 stop:1127 length:738 start_codon:yes stop_codon:yes gene_type:complete
MGKFQMRHLPGGGNKQSGIMMRGGSAFPKTALYQQAETGQQEAQGKADVNNANAKRVYGETTTTRTKEEGGTRIDFSTPYTTSGKGKAKRSGKPNASNADWQKFLDKNFEGSNEKFNASQSGKGVENKTRFIPNSVTELTEQKITMTPGKPTAEKIKITPRNTTTTTEKIKRTPKPKKGIKIGKVVKNVGEGIGDFVENTGEGIGDAGRFVGEKIGDAASFVGDAVSSLFGCRSCKYGSGTNRKR